MPLKQLDTWLIVKTSSIWMAKLYIICAVAFWLLPTNIVDVLWKPMFHAFGLGSGAYLLLGLVEAVVYTSLAVWLWMIIYNRLSKGKR